MRVSCIASGRLHIYLSAAEVEAMPGPYQYGRLNDGSWGVWSSSHGPSGTERENETILTIPPSVVDGTVRSFPIRFVPSTLDPLMRRLSFRLPAELLTSPVPPLPADIGALVRALNDYRRARPSLTFQVNADGFIRAFEEYV